jgi:hypothetical protein
MNYNSNPQYEDIIFLEKNSKKEKEYYSHMIKTQIEDLDITKAFKNFSPYKDRALVLIAPSNNMNIYDKILYEYCYLKMFSSNSNMKTENTEGNNKNQPSNNNKNPKSPTDLSNNPKKEESKDKIEQTETQGNAAGQQQKSEQGQVITMLTEIKYKEIILENNTDITGQDFEYIRTAIKTGGVIIIKNAHLLGNIFNELLKEIMQAKPDEISSNFKFVLICNQNEFIKWVRDKVASHARFKKKGGTINAYSMTRYTVCQGQIVCIFDIREVG